MKKSNDKNLLLIGALGVGAYFLAKNLKQSEQPVVLPIGGGGSSAEAPITETPSVPSIVLPEPNFPQYSLPTEEYGPLESKKSDTILYADRYSQPWEQALAKAIHEQMAAGRSVYYDKETGQYLITENKKGREVLLGGYDTKKGVSFMTGKHGGVTFDPSYYQKPEIGMPSNLSSEERWAYNMASASYNIQQESARASAFSGLVDFAKSIFKGTRDKSLKKQLYGLKKRAEKMRERAHENWQSFRAVLESDKPSKKKTSKYIPTSWPTSTSPYAISKWAATSLYSQNKKGVTSQQITKTLKSKFKFGWW